MPQQSQNLTTRVVTGKVRLSYVHIFEPYSSQQNQEPKFSVALLISKSDTATIGALRAAQRAALENGKAKFNGVIPKNWGDTIHDGDEEADLERNPEYAGHLYMSVSAKTRPGIVDRDLVPILDSSVVYSGCYARVSINAFAYNTQGKKGVSFGLNHVMFWSDGEFLGGRSSAADDFADVDREGEDSLI